MQQKIKKIISVSLIVLLGFLREYLFININWIFLTLTVNRMNGARPEFHFLLNWTVGEITLLKWVLTFIFTGLFFLLTYWIIHLFFQHKTYKRITVFAYAAIIGAAVFLLGIGKLFNFYAELYEIIRTLMGLVQSFMPVMILFILFKFLPDLKLK